MKKVRITALSGMITALSVTLMAATSVIPFLTYIMPIVTGVLVFFICGVSNKKYALGVYFSVGVLSLLLLTDKEAALTYILFFGYYPLIKRSLERLPRLLAILLKLLCFNTAIITVALLTVYVFGGAVEDYSSFGKFSVPLLLLLGNTVFVLYDIAFTKNLSVLDRISAAFLKKFK